MYFFPDEDYTNKDIEQMESLSVYKKQSKFLKYS